MVKKSLTELIMHMRWANEKIVVSLRNTFEERALRIFAHIVTTEQIYFDRIMSRDPWPQNFWPELSIEQITDCNRENFEKYNAFLEERTPEQLNDIVGYRNSQGIVCNSVIWEMILHLALHGEHHRGQIAKLIRNAGGEPVNTDYIVYTRQRK